VSNIILILLFSSIVFLLIRSYAYHWILVNKFKNYTDLLTHYLEMAYDAIYKDQIVTYTTDGTVPDNEALDTIKKNYIKLSLSLMGPKVEKVLLTFYGNRETLMETIVLHLQSKIDNDQILDLLKKKQGDDNEERGI